MAILQWGSSQQSVIPESVLERCRMTMTDVVVRRCRSKMLKVTSNEARSTHNALDFTYLRLSGGVILGRS